MKKDETPQQPTASPSTPFDEMGAGDWAVLSFVAFALLLFLIF